MMSMLMLTGASALPLRHLSTAADGHYALSPAVMGLEDDISHHLGNKVVMYSRATARSATNARGCSRTGHLRRRKIIELDLVEDGQAIQDALLAMTGQGRATFSSMGSTLVATMTRRGCEERQA